MMVHLVLLAHGAARDKGIDKGGQTRPLEVMFNDGFGVETPCMPRGGDSCKEQMREWQAAGGTYICPLK